MTPQADPAMPRLTAHGRTTARTGGRQQPRGSPGTSWDAVFDATSGPYGQLVRRGDAEHLLQLPGPARRSGARRPGSADLGQPDDRPSCELHLSELLDASPGWRRAGQTLGSRKATGW